MIFEHVSDPCDPHSMVHVIRTASALVRLVLWIFELSWEKTFCNREYGRLREVYPKHPVPEGGFISARGNLKVYEVLAICVSEHTNSNVRSHSHLSESDRRGLSPYIGTCAFGQDGVF